MSTATIHLPEDIAGDINNISKNLGFSSAGEFIEEAIRDKILEVRRQLFSMGTDHIAQGLKKKKITEQEVITDFLQQKHR